LIVTAADAVRQWKSINPGRRRRSNAPRSLRTIQFGGAGSGDDFLLGKAERTGKMERPSLEGLPPARDVE
jgi:hypothetical protein